MAGVATEEFGVGRSLEEATNGQQLCQSGEALVEWRSSEHIESGTQSISPPYWDSDDDDGGPKPSGLHGKPTWKIDKFSQVNKREHRSNAFEVAGYKWERADRPFRCLDCQYRRELVRVYLTSVETICRCFVEECRGKLVNLIEDKARWSSFRAFWLGMDQNSKCCISQQKTDTILKVIVKHFFIEKEVTSTLVMDSLSVV